MKQRGPRTSGAPTRDAILGAAREQFAAHGYEAATMRSIAAAAGVDVALPSYYFGSKSGLFVASLRLPVNPADVLDGLLGQGTNDLGPRILRQLLRVWDDPATAAPLISVLRSFPSQGDMLREFIESQMAPRLARVIEGPDAELRAAAAMTQVLGLLFARYVLRVEPVASAGHDEIVALLGPTLQRYLTGETATAG
jgi:AcrR family transcriptional regulator